MIILEAPVFTGAFEHIIKDKVRETYISFVYNLCRRGCDMNYSIYEIISNKSKLPVNAFVMSLDSVKWHWHKEYEFLAVLTGEMTLKIQSEEFNLKAGEFVLINQRVLHALQNSGNECLCMVVQLSDEFMLFDENEDVEEELNFYINSTTDEEPECGYELLYYRLAKIVYETISEKRTSIYRVRAQVCSLIADLMEFAIYDKRKKSIDSGNQQNLVRLLVDYLEENLMNDNVLDEVCKNFGISRKTLDRAVFGTLEITTKDLLDNLRVEKAKKLLKYSTKNTGYIMDVCGYASENTFYRSFKKYTGVTPKEYRDSVKREEDEGKLKGYLDYETPRVLAILKEIVEGWEKRNYM